MVSLLAILVIGLFNGIVWTWLASLFVPKTYAVATGVVMGLISMLATVVIQINRVADDSA